MRFTYNEKKDLFFGGLMISLAFAILLSGGLRLFNSGFLIVFIIAFLTAGIGFLLHELMHKYIATHYKLKTEFRAHYGMLWLAIAFSFFGFIIAAPGAVYIFGRINKEKNGKISIAGPLTNFSLAIIFLILLLVLSPKGILNAFFSFGLTINSLLAAFNMIPTMPFDGGKVIQWNKPIYYTTAISSVLLFILSLII